MTSKKALRKSITAVVTVAALAVSGTAVAQAVNFGAPKGVDVAAHQHPGGTPIDWSKVRSDGQSFAFVKATEGGDWVNPHYVQDIQAANAAGLKTGAYHYACLLYTSPSPRD